MSDEIAMMNPLAGLNIELKGQDFTPVLIPPGQVPLQIVEAGPHQSKSTGKQSLKIKCVTVMDLPSTVAGQQVEAGHELEMYLGLQVDPTLEGQEAINATKRLRKKLQNLMCAAFQCGIEQCPDLNAESLQQLPGKQVIGEVDIESDPVYGDRNRLQAILPQNG